MVAREAQITEKDLHFLGEVTLDNGISGIP